MDDPKPAGLHHPDNLASWCISCSGEGALLPCWGTYSNCVRKEGNGDLDRPSGSRFASALPH